MMEHSVQIAPHVVRAQLGRILASDGFIRARRMQRFLAFVVMETLEGRADQLGEYGIGLSVFDRPVDFEPGLDPIVRNDARRLRLKLLEYYLRAGRSDQLVIDIPKGGYIPVFRPIFSVKSRDLCRVMINLVRIPEGTQLWAESFDCPTDGLWLPSEMVQTALREVTARLAQTHPASPLEAA